MFNKINKLESSEGNVWKYIFKSDDAVAEAVLYRYESFNERTVICCSVQSGCPVGCTFCGTGKHFARNLTDDEIVDQITHILDDNNLRPSQIAKFQIMFMSMGEPMLNWDNLERAIKRLNTMYGNADLLISTIGVDNDEVFGRIIALSKAISKLGLQFSIHKSNNTDRNELIPYKNKMELRKLRNAGLTWWKETGRKPYLNYCVDGMNSTYTDYANLSILFSPVAFNMTFSVVCSSDETMKEAGYKNFEDIMNFQNHFINDGYNTRIFDPAGQDDIGGGCGQLWYVQEWLKERAKS